MTSRTRRTSNFRLFIPQLHHSLIQNLHIRLITQVGNESRLLGAQQITRTANIQVLHGDMDTGTQVAELLESLQSPATLYGQCRQRRCQQIAESLAVAASHTASHLV